MQNVLLRITCKLFYSAVGIKDWYYIYIVKQLIGL